MATLGWNIHIIMSYKDASMCTWDFSKYTSLHGCNVWQSLVEVAPTVPNRQELVELTYTGMYEPGQLIENKQLQSRR